MHACRPEFGKTIVNLNVLGEIRAPILSSRQLALLRLGRCSAASQFLVTVALASWTAF